MLEKTNGWLLLQELKSNSILSNIPVIVINMDEEANCGFGLSVFEYVANPLRYASITNFFKDIENRDGIRFNNILVIASNNESLNFDENNNNIKVVNVNEMKEYINEIVTYCPDVILMDLFDTSVNNFEVVDGIKSNLSCKDIPIIVFLNDNVNQQKIVKLNNYILETTLLRQYHPLDILKIIKDRIELIDSGLFQDDREVIYSNDSSPNRKTLKDFENKAKAKILIVDDSPDARFTIGEIVSSLGYQTDFAIDGFECLEKIRKNEPDLVLLDIMMPKMDGFQTIHEIRKDNKLKNIIVYALTAYAMLSDKEIIEKNGFNGLITKPVNTIQLERKLNQILEAIIDENKENISN